MHRTDGFGYSVAGVGDLDGDKLGEALIGALWDDPSVTDSGSCWLFSGQKRLTRFVGKSAFDGLGSSVAGVGDVDGDGVPDMAGGAVQGFPGTRPGFVLVWSGKTLKELYRIDGRTSGSWFGHSLAAAGDVNKDGFADLLVGASHETSPIGRGGSAWVFGGSHVAFRGNRKELSLTSGGVQILSLDARPVRGGELYWVFGSASGTAPGIDFGRTRLPLVNDAYTAMTLSQPNIPPLRLSFGRLDSSGRKTMFFQLPRGLPVSLIGLELHHAFITLDQGGYIRFASNPVSLKLIR